MQNNIYHGRDPEKLSSGPYLASLGVKEIKKSFSFKSYFMFYWDIILILWSAFEVVFLFNFGFLDDYIKKY